MGPARSGRFINSNIVHLRIIYYDSDSDIQRRDDGLWSGIVSSFCSSRRYIQRSAHVTSFLLPRKGFFGINTVLNKTLVHFRLFLAIDLRQQERFRVQIQLAWSSF